ncbi:PREDICTED: RING finger protein 207-like [Ceratosolen solmsi marchali]|uniref:RING finger protein 207 n=1 Tax=Ceratosolen solmsi marchali TaxID=326594 RepID=A0AAJ7E100_9HYME|nr:PREDICTED: RING finger protein 207-like [Ceratosolen solmsi marchali]
MCFVFYGIALLISRCLANNISATKHEEMASSNFIRSDAIDSENVDDASVSAPTVISRNPLLCSICHDYYNDPCLLSCFHTFCVRCLRGPQLDGKISCPICGQTTQMKDGAQQPPIDQLMRQLVELANCENPPCANCEKRDKTTMFFCTTCGQALCTHCREHTHRAKMFSSHEVIHMSKCKKDTQRRCHSHGEQYIMFNQTDKCMLCATCFRDTPADVRLHCVDIDTAWQQTSKKMEHAVNSICELQAAMREGLLDLKSQLDELKHNVDTEKRGLNAYCQGIQEAVNKTHSTVLLELHRDFDIKEKMVRTQLLSLGIVLPALQTHLGLCTAFTSATSKYQFLELAHPMLERLGRVAQLGHLSRPPLLNAHLNSSYKSEFARTLQPFVIGLALMPKEIIYDHMQLQSSQKQDTHLIQQCKSDLKLQTKSVYESSRFNNHCKIFDNELQELSNQLKTVKERLGELHRDVTLLRRANTLTLGTRYENVSRDCSLLEQQLEYQQVELERLRTMFDALWEEQYSRIQLEKEIFYSQMNNILSLKGEVKQLHTVAQQLEPFIKSFVTGINPSELNTIASDINSQKHFQALLDHLGCLKIQEPTTPSTKEYRHQRNCSANDNAMYTKDSKEIPTRCRTPCSGTETVLDSSGNIVVYETKLESKRGVLSQLIEKARIKEDRKKSTGSEEVRDRSHTRRSRKFPENIKPKTPPGHSSTSKVLSLYRTLKGGNCGNDVSIEVIEHQVSNLPPQQLIHQDDEYEYQRISEASSVGEVKKRVQAQVHPVPEEVISLKNSEDMLYANETTSVNKRERRRRRASCDSLSTGSESRRSSITDGAQGLSAQDTGKTLVFLIGSSPTSSSLTHKQRSWETFPRPKSKRNICVSYGNTNSGNVSGDGDSIKKADSFEGHEEAVRTLVAAVQETRSQLRQHHFHQHRYHRKNKTN